MSQKLYLERVNRTLLIAVFTLSGLAILCANGLAQDFPPQMNLDTTQTPLNNTDNPENLGAKTPVTEDYPEPYLIEAQKFQAYCENRLAMRDYYDCSCLSVEYLKRRKELGPFVHGTSIVSDISDTCSDATGAAGTLYNQCIGTDKTISEVTPIENYCTCLANTYSELYKESNMRPNSRTMVALQTSAKLRCRNEMAGINR